MYHQVSVATLLPWMELLLKKSLLKRCTCSGNEINFTILVSWTSNFLPGQNEEKATVNPRNEEGEIDHISSKVISQKNETGQFPCNQCEKLYTNRGNFNQHIATLKQNLNAHKINKH